MEPDQIDMMNEEELRGELRKLIARPSSCTVDSIVRNMWNYFADGYNQWDSLGQDEKDTLFKVAVANGQAHRPATPETADDAAAIGSRVQAVVGDGWEIWDDSKGDVKGWAGKISPPPVSTERTNTKWDRFWFRKVHSGKIYAGYAWPIFEEEGWCHFVGDGPLRIANVPRDPHGDSRVGGHAVGKGDQP